MMCLLKREMKLEKMEGINVFIYAADLATLISDARMNAIDKYSPQIPPTVYGRTQW
jgi:hypothetical protein